MATVSGWIAVWSLPNPKYKLVLSTQHPASDGRTLWVQARRGAWWTCWPGTVRRLLKVLLMLSLKRQLEVML
jgi:hypothetical protein